VGVTQSNGRFIYRTYLDDPRVDSKSYNLLRHAGTIYAMSAAQEHNPSPELGQAIDRATRFLIEQIQPLHDSPSPLAVWSRPQIRTKLECQPRSSEEPGWVRWRWLAWNDSFLGLSHRRLSRD
jgi:hypothetical protein